MRKDYYFPSSDGVTRIHGAEWIPEGEVRAVLQICHGMTEYILRYDHFARFLNQHGIYVTGHDHLGHGESVSVETGLMESAPVTHEAGQRHGYFHHPDGNECLIRDIHRVRCITRKKYPGLPYFVLGHSMGSFLVRQYMMLHGGGIKGVIIMGTGSPAPVPVAAGMILCRLLAALKGWEYRCKLVDSIVSSSYNNKFQPVRTPYDWLSKDKEMVDAYAADPWCSFLFTLNGFYQMFRGIRFIQKRKNIRRFPLDCPVLLVSGGDDPVGECGRGIRKVYRDYRRTRTEPDLKKLVKMRLYPGDRHEILNETDRRKVYQDLLMWMEYYL